MGKHTVKCELCFFEKNRMCTVKKSSVNIHKNRHCDVYEESVDKIEMKELWKERHNPVPITTRPDWYWDDKLLKKIRRNMKNEEENINNKTVVPDLNHPISGDLSRFTSTAVK